MTWAISKQPAKTGIPSVEPLGDGRFAVVVDGYVRSVSRSQEECVIRARALAPKQAVDPNTAAQALGRAIYPPSFAAAAPLSPPIWE